MMRLHWPPLWYRRHIARQQRSVLCDELEPMLRWANTHPELIDHKLNNAILWRFRRIKQLTAFIEGARDDIQGV